MGLADSVSFMNGKYMQHTLNYQYFISYNYRHFICFQGPLESIIKTLILSFYKIVMSHTPVTCIRVHRVIFNAGNVHRVSYADMNIP